MGRVIYLPTPREYTELAAIAQQKRITDPRVIELAQQKLRTTRQRRKR